MTLEEYLKANKITQRKFAESIGYTQGMVHRWVNYGKYSPKSAIVVEKATNGLVPKHETCPEVFSR